MKQVFRKMPLFAALMLALLAGLAASLLLPDRAYSETENKYLSSMPALTLRSLSSGSFMEKYETYLSDQFPLRDGFVTAKSAAEALLLKTENNGVLYGKDGYLFQKFQSWDEAQFAKNLASLSAFAEKTSARTTALIVPSPLAVLTDKLPAGVYTADEAAGLAAAKDALSGIGWCDAYAALSAHADAYIYYRTDHHWTTLGARYAYEALCGELGLVPISYDDVPARTAEGFLGTSYSKCRKLGTAADTITYYDFDAALTVGGVARGGLYDFTKLQTRDKYAMFLGGNAAESVIESDSSAGKRGSLLVIKDSYADCLVPFLTAHYETIVCIDPRYYTGSFSELAAQQFDDVLLLFGFEDLAGEPSLVKLGL